MRIFLIYTNKTLLQFKYTLHHTVVSGNSTVCWSPRQNVRGGGVNAPSATIHHDYVINNLMK